MGRHWVKWVMNRGPHEKVPLARDHTTPIRMDQDFCQNHVEVEIGVAHTFMHLYFFEVDQHHRRQGFGSKAMDEIVAYAKINNLDVVLTASDALGSNLDHLIQFYKRWGFQEGYLERIPYRHNMYLLNHHQSETKTVFNPQRNRMSLCLTLKHLLQTGRNRHGRSH